MKRAQKRSKKGEEEGSIQEYEAKGLIVMNMFVNRTTCSGVCCDSIEEIAM